MFPTKLTSEPEVEVAVPNEVTLLAMPTMPLKAVFNSEIILDDAVLEAAAEDDEVDEATFTTVLDDVTAGLATAMIGDAVAVAVAVGLAIGEEVDVV